MRNPLLLGALIVAVVAGLLFYFRPRSGTLPKPRAVQAEKSGTLAVNVTRDKDAMIVRWKRDSPPIRSATHAILYIIDGRHQSQFDLSPAQLVSASLSYWPDTPDVTFRLAVSTPQGEVTETTRGPAIIPMPAAPAPPPKRVPITPARTATVRSRARQTQVAADPPPSRWRRTIGKVPLLRRLKKHRNSP